MQKKLEALKTADIIGCTTTGAARVLNLLAVSAIRPFLANQQALTYLPIQSLAPKVILVEEAGQVLEAHSLATLVPSVEHFISIGDPQQLRPSISTYGKECECEELVLY